MRIICPYNEILPKKSAHDVYIARNCAALAAVGADVTLLCGAGSRPPEELTAHYNLKSSDRLHWRTLPIIRKNLILPFNCNSVFFWATQAHIRRSVPDWVVLSVLKQGAFHLKHRVRGVKYVYEVHELAYYPGRDIQNTRLRRQLEMERRMLSQADAVTVTTGALKDILQAPPYRLSVPIEIVPLAVDFAPLPPPSKLSGDLHIMYVGQMYQEQGVDLLLRALAHTEGIRLTLVGGKPHELAALRQFAVKLGIDQRVEFAGFKAPTDLPAFVARANAFVAPFSASGRMPYVVHTKLLEYAAWQRPVIAPDLPVTREHFAATGGWVSFEAGNVGSLAEALQAVAKDSNLQNLYEACRQHRVLNWMERSRMYMDFLRSI